MQEIVVKNYNETQGETQGQGNNTFTVKPVAAGKCNANFVELEPGNTAYGYHWHEENEEVFYIISGEAGSHVISNPSKTEKLVYLDFGTANLPDIVHFTGTNAGWAVTKEKVYNI